MRSVPVASIVAAALLLTPALSSAAPVSIAEAERIESGLAYKTGTLVVKDAQIALPAGYRYLNAADAQTVLEKLYGNPPDRSILALIVPPGGNVLTSIYDVVVTYDASGHISDSDAASTNYDDLLSQIKKDAADANPDRLKNGYAKLEVAGWAEPPHYDSATHKLYWAEDQLIDGKSHGLNYDVRVLGREGSLDLSALAAMADLPAVRPGMQTILKVSSFASGRAYADYTDGDKTSNLTVAALVAGGAVVAAKTGLIAVLLAKAKFLLIGLLALVRPIIRRFRRTPPATSAADGVQQPVDVAPVVPEPDRGADRVEAGDGPHEDPGPGS
jgi:uncharacterized membrane-anchored protein